MLEHQRTQRSAAKRNLNYFMELVHMVNIYSMWGMKVFDYHLHKLVYLKQTGGEDAAFIFG